MTMVGKTVFVRHDSFSHTKRRSVAVVAIVVVAMRCDDFSRDSRVVLF